MSAEKRRKFFRLTKGVNSAPCQDPNGSSFDEYPLHESGTSKEYEYSSSTESFTTVGKALEEVLKNTALVGWNSTPTSVDNSPKRGWNENVQNTFQGLVRSRDGSHLSPNTQPFISLPSPNIQSAKSTVPLVDSLVMVEEAKPEETTPDSSQMIRRGALVPPKMDSGGGGTGGAGTGGNPEKTSSTSPGKGSPCRPGALPRLEEPLDRSQSSNEDKEKIKNPPQKTSPPNEASSNGISSCDKPEDILKRLGEEDSSKNKLANIEGRNYPRRSSVVVIPPMQVCPGDLLVYSKALTRLGNEIDGTSNTNLVSDHDHLSTTQSSATRKGKNTWSLLKIFEREKKVPHPKTEDPVDLETILINMSPSEFTDERLSRLLGLSWLDFLDLLETDRRRSVSFWRYQESGNNDSDESEDNGSSSITLTSHLPPSFSPVPERKYPSHFRRPSSPLTEEKEEDDSIVSPTTITPVVTPPRKGSDLTKSEIKRREAIWDLFQSENTFLIDHLMVYMEPLKKVQVEGSLMFAEPEVLFGNLDELSCVSYSFCKDFLSLLLDLVCEDGSLPVIDLMAGLFGQKGQKARTLSQAYHRYALNYINALNYLESLRRNQEFCDFEKWCNRDIRCKKLQLTDLLVAPVHHIMKIPLVVRDILAKTVNQEEKKVISKILEMKEVSLRELDDKMKWLKNFDRLLEIQRNIVWPSFVEMESKQYVPEFLKSALSRQPCERLIVSPRRQIIMEGPLLLLDSGKPTEMFVILFDDLLVITRKKKSLTKKKSTLTENWGGSLVKNSDVSMKYIVHKQPLSLDRFFIHEVSSSEAASAKLDNAFILICLNRFQQIIVVHTFQADTESLKQTWIQKLKEAQDVWKKTLQKTIFKGTRGPTNNHSPTDDKDNPIPNLL